jgi:transposase
MATELLPDELWEEISPLLPPPAPHSSKGGRPTVDNRAALQGILFVNRSGIPWQMLPTEVFGVSGTSCWRRLRDWTRAGIWPELQKRLLNRLGKAGGVNLTHVVVDSQSVRAVSGGSHAGPNSTDRGKPGCKRHVLTDVDGVPLVVQTTPANVNDEKQLPKLLEAMPAVQGPRGRPRRKPDSIFGDRAYGTALTILLVVSMGIFSFLARRNDHTHGSGLGTFRYVVERTLAWFSQFRRLRVCYERCGEHFQAFHELAASCLIAKRLKQFAFT